MIYLEAEATEFLRNGQVLLPSNNLEIRAQVAIQGFLEFLEKPEGEKAPWTLCLEDGAEADDGYIPRDGGKNHDPAKPRYDRKWFFHYRPRVTTALYAAGVRTTEAEEQWLDHCHLLFSECLTMTLELAIAMKHQENGQDVIAAIEKCKTHVLRLLVYNEQGRTDGGGEVLGKGHFDRDLITIHAAESRPGLLLGLHGESGLYVPQRGKVLAMAGTKMWNRSGRQVPPVWHSVLNPPGAPRNRRWSIVFFSHIDGDDTPPS